MLNFRKFFKSVHIRKVFLSFVLVFLIPFVIITSMILQNLFDSFSRQTTQEQLLRTQQAMDDLQDWLTAFDQIVMQLVGDNELARDRLHLYSEQSNLQHRLTLMIVAHTGLKNIWYQLPNDMGFISGNDSLSVSRMNEHRYLDESNTGRTVYERLLNGEKLSLYDRQSLQNSLFYPVFVGNGSGGGQLMIVFELKMQAITDVLENLLGTFPGKVRLRSADGQMLTAIANQYDGEFASPLACTQTISEPYAVWSECRGGMLQGEHVIFTSVAAQQWAIDLISVNNLMGSFQVMQSVTLMLMLVFVLGCLVCLTLTVRLYKPIRSLRDTLSSVNDAADEALVDDYDYIESSIELISTNNRHLRRMLQEHGQKAQEFVASMLFSGRIRSREELQSTYSFCGCTPPHGPYWIVVMDAAAASAKNLEKDGLKTAFVLTAHTHVVMLCTQCDPELLPKKGLGISGPSEDWTDIPLHCARAWFACTMGTVCFDAERCRTTALNGGETLHDAFQTVLAERKPDALREVRQHFSSDNWYVQTCALAALILEWMEECDRVPLDDASLFFIPPKATDAECRNTYDALLSLLDLRLEPEEGENGDMLEQMYQYIARHYDTPDFSIKQMASDFSMSISGLSAYFKNRAGALLSDYITGMKMKKAMQLLEFSNLSIQEVGLAIGYLNVNSFNRRFQQLYDISPKEYRAERLAGKKV